MSDTELLKQAKTSHEVYMIIENDLERFPVPFIMDPYQEQQELYRRDKYIQDFARRYFKMFLSKQTA